jgi:hypothetical protein
LLGGNGSQALVPRSAGVAGGLTGASSENIVPVLARALRNVHLDERNMREGFARKPLCPASARVMIEKEQELADLGR